MHLEGNDPLKFIHEAMDQSDPPLVTMKWNARNSVQIESNNEDNTLSLL